MKYLNKKAFTLIELLAVILILGIIALIAVPTVSKVVKETKKGALKSSSQNIVRAVEQKCQLEQLKGEQITKYYRIEDGISLTNIDVKGQLPNDGSIVVDDECNVKLVANKENYIAVKNINDDEVTIIEDRYYKPGESVTYNPGDSNYTNWYVVKDNGDTVTLLLSKSIDNSNIVWISHTDYQAKGGSINEMEANATKYGPITVLKQFSSATNAWNVEAKKNIRLLGIADILEVLGLNNFSIDEKLYFDTKSNVVPVVDGTSKYAWLFDNIYNCLKFGCNTENNGNNIYGYWLSDYIANSNFAYVVNNIGAIYKQKILWSIEPVLAITNCSIRPVITVPKTSIQ